MNGTSWARGLGATVVTTAIVTGLVGCGAATSSPDTKIREIIAAVNSDQCAGDWGAMAVHMTGPGVVDTIAAFASYGDVAKAAGCAAEHIGRAIVLDATGQNAIVTPDGGKTYGVSLVSGQWKIYVPAVSE